MTSINMADREINCKIVYYGPGLCGKTTNLIYIHKHLQTTSKRDLITLATENERTIFFDFLPLEVSTISGFVTRFQLYTIPGQIFYNATRRIILQGVDGIVFVADSQWDKQRENLESFENLKENLASYNLLLENVPLVLQYNKRDLERVALRQYMEFLMNKGPRRVPAFEAVAVQGAGVFDTLNAICHQVITKLIQDVREN